MFNLFKKSSSSCYLTESKVFEQSILEEDELSVYNEFLSDKDIPDELRLIITKFLVPYKISFLKFNLNKEYYGNPYPIDYRHNHKHIAPSLKLIKANKKDVPLAYPNWVFAAFPDVIWWIMNDGKSQMANIIKNRSMQDISDGRYIKDSMLIEIINLYMNKTGKQLECRKY